MSSKQLPKELPEDQIKFWLANSSITREQLMEWYKTFCEFAKANNRLDKENFVKFFDKLNVKKNNADTFYKLAFKGDFLIKKINIAFRFCFNSYFLF